VGMKPRWQLFLTGKLLPDLAGLMRLGDQMCLRERVERLGGDLDIFVHTPDYVGEGRQIADLGVTLDETRAVPLELIASTRKHFRTENLWTTEAKIIADILAHPGERAPVAYGQPMLWFSVENNWDVYSNSGNYGPWWRLGNLKSDSIATIFENYEQDKTYGLGHNRPDIMPELVRRYGNPESQKVVAEIEEYWYNSYCEEMWQA